MSTLRIGIAGSDPNFDLFIHNKDAVVDSMTQDVDYYGHRLAEVNKHNQVTASENIYNEQGALLLSKGSELSQARADVIAKHKLVKPLEHSVNVAESMNAKQLFEVIEEHTRELPGLHVIKEDQEIRAVLMKQCLFYEKFPLLRQKLTVLKEQLPHIYYNSLYSATMGLVLAVELDRELQDIQAVFIGGLMHNTGFLHLDPELTKNEVQLERDESLQIQVHPIIAKEFLNQVPKLPKHVGQAVEDHHERTDGTGYPKHKFGVDLSMASQVLAYTDMLVNAYNRCAPYKEHAHQLTLTILQINGNVHFETVYKASVKLIRLGPMPSSPPNDPPRASAVMIQQERITETFSAAKKLGFVLMKNTRSRLTKSIASMLGRIATSIISAGIMQEEYHEWLNSLVLIDDPNEHLSLLKSKVIQDEIEEQLEDFKAIMWKTIKKIPEDQNSLIEDTIRSYNQIESISNPDGSNGDNSQRLTR